MRLILLPLALLIAMTSLGQNKEVYLITGTYTNWGSEGIYVVKFDTATGSLRQVSTAKANNPSFVISSPDKKYVYAVLENAGPSGGEAAAFSFNADKGELTFINKQFTEGNHPCHLAIDKSGKQLFASNYSGGNLAAFSIRADGGLDKAAFVSQHEGRGAHPERQQKPHVHSSILSPDKEWLFVADLGSDKIVPYKINKKTRALQQMPAVATSPGAGPRHMRFHPSGKFLYVIEELSGHVSTYSYKKGVLTAIQRVSSLPEGDTRFAGSADIHISADGNFLYASNRAEHNNIVIYSIDKKTGLLTTAGFQSVLGKAPRNFTIDPSQKFLLVANQDTNEIVVFKRDKTSGLLEDSGNRLKISRPVCLEWILP